MVGKRFSGLIQNNQRVFFQILINENLEIIKQCFGVLVMETENQRIMDARLEKILGESSI